MAEIDNGGQNLSGGFGVEDGYPDPNTAEDLVGGGAGTIYVPVPRGELGEL